MVREGVGAAIGVPEVQDSFKAAVQREGVVAVEAVHERFPHFGSRVVGEDVALDVRLDVGNKE